MIVAASLLVVLAVSGSESASAQEGNPIGWIVMPLVQPIVECAAANPDIAARLETALATPEGRANNLLPPGFLESLVARAKNSDTRAAPPADCESTVAALKTPRFALEIRQAMLFPLTMSAFECMALPGGEATRTALADAVHRNGLSLDESALELGIEAAKKSQADAEFAGATPAACDKLRQYLQSPKFDSDYSEASVRQMLRML
jgi:hypothetical protein